MHTDDPQAADRNTPPHLERDFVGYGETPPHADWPGGAKLAINFVVNYEEGSGVSIPDGDGTSEASLTESPDSPNGPGSRDLAAESMYEYGTRAGFWRVMRLFSERGLPATANACALAVERNLEAAAAMRKADWDVCCHGWRWIEHWTLSEEEERAHIQRAVASLEKTMGMRPEGWYCRHGPSVNTRRLVVEHGGFLYDSDSYADDLPVLDQSRRHAASGRALFAGGQRFEVLAEPFLDWRRLCILLDRRDRLLGGGRRTSAEDDVVRSAPSPDRPSGARGCPRQRTQLRGGPQGYLGDPADRYRPTLA